MFTAAKVLLFIGKHVPCDDNLLVNMPGGKHVKALVVNHPSVGYSWDYWYRVIQHFLRNS